MLGYRVCNHGYESSDLNRGDWDDSNGANRLQIGLLLRKLQVKVAGFVGSHHGPKILGEKRLNQPLRQL